ncbi:MAG: phenylacetate--CoA ligase [Coriobacteriales bacterium]|nr:phenylacetate--CoA ligase [Coriobacteriales bacterium]
MSFNSSKHKLENIVCYTNSNLEFYKNKYIECGLDKLINSQNFNLTQTDFQKIPFTCKQDLRNNYPFGLFAVDRSEVVRLHASSGTTGLATVVGYTQQDLDMWADCFIRALKLAGVTKDMTVQIAFGYGLFTGGIGAHYGAEKMGCCVVPVSSGNTNRQIKLMQDFGTEVLACTPSYAMHIAQTALSMGIDPKSLPLKVGIFGAEPSSIALLKSLEDTLGIKAYDIYGLSEIMGPGVASMCKQQQGLHLNEDNFYAEIIDPKTGQNLPNGQLGELVITTLTKQCCPLVRYRTGDITKIYEESCSCGLKDMRIDKISGRSDDMLIIRGVNVFPKQIEQVIAQFKEIVPYYLITLTNENTLDKAVLQVELALDFDLDEVKKIEKLKRDIANEIKAQTQVSMQIQLVQPNTLKRYESKSVHVVDNRK